MGDVAGGGCSDQKPVHSVSLSSFILGKYEVTQEQWLAVMGSNPSQRKGLNRACRVIPVPARSVCSG